MRDLSVNLPGAAYTIHIGAGASSKSLRAMVQEVAKELVVVVTNDTVDGLYPQRIAKELEGLPCRVEHCIVKDGEQYKNLDTLETILNRMMEVEANRSTLVVAFGGGVVGDMAGFAAATFMRGVPVVQVPTTLLSHVDSSVGGKTAVNLPMGKNAVGAFKQPNGVVIDLEFLATLPERELHAGMFELIKHGIIRDLEMFEFLETNQDKFSSQDWDFWEEAVFRSCRVKASVVEQDEKETDLRAILNFGHTLAHLIETHTGYDTYLHGEAVGTGMIYAAYASKAWGMLSEEEYERILALLAPLARPIVLPPLDEERFTGLLMHDKKASNRTVRFVALRQLGHAIIREGTTPAEMWPLFQQFLADHSDLIQVEDKG